MLGALCATVGSVMATEAVKLVCGSGSRSSGGCSSSTRWGGRWRTLPVRAPEQRRPVTELIDYDAFCGTPSPRPPRSRPAADGDEIDVRTLARMLAARDAGEEDFVLVDVREPHEREIVTIPGAVAVPLAELEADPPAVGADGRRVVLHCRSGERSGRALAALRAAGRTDAVHVAGGVLAWVREIEPGKPVY